jgi:hypothetical protein
MGAVGMVTMFIHSIPKELLGIEGDIVTRIPI